MLKGPKGRELEILEFHTPSRVPKVTSDYKFVGPPTKSLEIKFVVNQILVQIFLLLQNHLLQVYQVLSGLLKEPQKHRIWSEFVSSDSNQLN